MSQIGVVNVKFVSSVGGLTSGVDAAGKAFKTLGGDTSALRASLSQLQKAGTQSVADIGPAASTARAAVVQFSEQIAALRQQFVTGAATAGDFAAGMRTISAEVQATARAVANAASLAREYATAESLLFDELQTITEAVKLGGLAEDVAARAREAAISKFFQSAAAANTEAAAVDSLTAALGDFGGLDLSNPFAGIAAQVAADTAKLQAESEKAAFAIMDQEIALELAAEEAQIAATAIESLSATFARGADITRQNATAQERYAETIAELDQLLKAGAISQQTYDRAAQSAAARMREGGAAAKAMDSGLSGIATRLNVLIGLDIARLFSSITASISNAVGSFVSMGQAEAGVIDQTSKLAARLGVTYGEMAGLSLAAEKSGVSMDTMKDAMTKADVAFANAANGSSQAAAAFDRVGLSAQQLNGMGTADRFQAIAAAIAELPTEAERAAAAVQIFGRSGAELLPLFQGGAAGIAAAREEADRLGLSLTTAQGQDVQKLVSSFETAQNAIQGVVQQVTAYLSPAITGVVSQFNEFIANIGGANIGQAIGEGILAGAEYLAGIADWVITNFSGTFSFLSSVWEQAGAVVSVLSRAASFLSGVFNAAQAGLGLIIRGFSGVFENLAAIASRIAGLLGFDTGTIDQLVAGAQAFNAELDRGITENVNAAGRDFGAAFAADAKPLGQAVAGPITTALRDARNSARDSAKQIEETKKKPVEIKQETTVNIAQALKAVDSRSKEGVAEMFRLMRGDTGNVQEKQLEALQTIADNTASMEDIPALALTGA